MPRKKRQSQDEFDTREFVNDYNNTRKEFSLNAFKVNVKPSTENQQKFASSIREKEVTIGSGFAGCGKTFMTCAESLKLLQTGKYKKIILIKSVTALSGEEIGFLKGDLADKMAPFMYSFRYNFQKIIGEGFAKKLEEKGYIEVLPLAFIRGINIDNAIVIVDEAQNITINNMRSIMTRLGENSKLVIIGDTKQIDMRNKKNSSLGIIEDKFEGKSFAGVIRFDRSDQVRNPIINDIEEIFDDIDSPDVY
jgi:phosphate starvation-inducible PhoH-like protein